MSAVQSRPLTEALARGSGPRVEFSGALEWMPNAEGGVVRALRRYEDRPLVILGRTPEEEAMLALDQIADEAFASGHGELVLSTRRYEVASLRQLRRRVRGVVDGYARADERDGKRQVSRGFKVFSDGENKSQHLVAIGALGEVLLWARKNQPFEINAEVHPHNCLLAIDIKPISRDRAIQCARSDNWIARDRKKREARHV
ncbi:MULTISPECIES: hypothetical protein [Methylosinus]|uniref:Uncharacterized protein n=1 Tax=Methylosinus trichosporium (strain ATCC 35070 / NCIMB 11131 / UNIQEM 75 / OB3b) TaxID=595536 RepID=A0A2D2D175_METT3|nr:MULTISPECIES: hypothetical protein [Methylosinus]ATQ68732.1 hypothetical protein CQW49_13200 [Methylosinus trichosporium OB3b]OBS53109.1 hypothetical protein A8B73_07315 [Methylosinus sp. 3S-1]